MVNLCFTEVIEVIQAHGGDVLKFAGDALFAVWPVKSKSPSGSSNDNVATGKGQGGDRKRKQKRRSGLDRRSRGAEKEEEEWDEDEESCLAEQVLRAVQCGLQVQEQHEFGDAKQLRLKITVSAGPLKAFNVGGISDRWEYLVAGTPLQQIERCADLAQPGDVLVTPEVLDVGDVQAYLSVDIVSTEEKDESSGEGRTVAAQEANGGRGRGGAATNAAMSAMRSSLSFTSRLLSAGRSTPGTQSPINPVPFRAKSSGSLSRPLPSNSLAGGGMEAGCLAFAYRVSGLMNRAGEHVSEVIPPRPLLPAEERLKAWKVKRSDSRGDEIQGALLRYVPHAARESMMNMGNKGPSFQWLGEIRQCSVIFVNFSGIDYNLENVVLLLQNAMTTMQTLIAHHSGSVRQFLVEDKGSTLIAAWGLPGSTHEDDALRAVMVAMNIAKALNDMKLPNRIGITTGEAFCGNVGSKKRCEYALYGDVVNTAARFMSNKVNEGILVCDTTMTNSRSRVVFSAARSLRLKGKETLVNAYTPVGMRSDVERESLKPIDSSDEGQKKVSVDSVNLAFNDDDDDDDDMQRSIDGALLFTEKVSTSRFESPVGVNNLADNEGTNSSSPQDSGLSTSIDDEVNDEKSDDDLVSSSVGVERAMRDGSKACETSQQERHDREGKRIVGRVAERVMLCAKISAAASSGENHAIILEGESGIGKTALVNEIITTVKLAGVQARILKASAEGIESPSQYLVVGALLRQLLEIDNAKGHGQNGGAQGRDGDGSASARENSGAEIRAKLLEVLGSYSEHDYPPHLTRTRSASLATVEPLRRNMSIPFSKERSSERRFRRRFVSMSGVDTPQSDSLYSSLFLNAKYQRSPRQRLGLPKDEYISLRLGTRPVEHSSAMLKQRRASFGEHSDSGSFGRSLNLPKRRHSGFDRSDYMLSQMRRRSSMLSESDFDLEDGHRSTYSSSPEFERRTARKSSTPERRISRASIKGKTDARIARTSFSGSYGGTARTSISGTDVRTARTSLPGRTDARTARTSIPGTDARMNPSGSEPESGSGVVGLETMSRLMSGAAAKLESVAAIFSSSSGGGAALKQAETGSRDRTCNEPISRASTDSGLPIPSGNNLTTQGGRRPSMRRTSILDAVTDTGSVSRSIFNVIANNTSGSSSQWPMVDPVIYSGKVLEAAASNRNTISNLLPLLNPILGVELSKQTLQIAHISRVKILMDLIVLIFERLSEEKTILIVIDNVNWMDTSSWSIIHALSASKAKVVLIFITRTMNGRLPDVVDSNLCAIRSHSMLWLRLNGLTSEETLKLVCQRFDLASLPEDVASTVVQRSSGNPFFALELVRSMLESHVLTVSPDRVCELAPEIGSKLRLPTSIAGALRIRLDSLRPQLQLVVKFASVVGKEFDIQMLNRVMLNCLSVEEIPDVDAEVVELTNLGILRASSDPERVGTLEFKSDMLRKMAYGMLPHAARRPAHETVARSLEQSRFFVSARHGFEATRSAFFYGISSVSDADLSHEFCSSLAYHWARAGNDERALGYLGMAGECAMLRFELQQAIVYFAQAVTMAHEAEVEAGGIPMHSNIVRKVRWLRWIGEARIALGERNLGEKCLRQALMLLSKPTSDSGCFGNSTRKVFKDFDMSERQGGFARDRAVTRRRPSVFTYALARGLLSMLGRKIWGRKQPTAVLVRAKKKAQQAKAHGDSPSNIRVIKASETANIYLCLFELYSLSQDGAGAAHAAVAAVNAAEHGASLDDLARAYVSVSLCAAIFGLHSVAKTYSDRANIVLEEMQLMNEGPDVHAPISDGDIFSSLQTRPSLTFVYLLTGTRELGMANLNAARDAFLLCAEASEKAGDNRRWQQGLLSLAFTSCLLGHGPESMTMIEQASMFGSRTNDVRLQLWGQMGLCLISLSSRMVDEVLILSSSIDEILAEHPEFDTEPDIFCFSITVIALRSVALLRKGIKGEARPGAEEALQRLEALHGWPNVHTFHANAALLEVIAALLSDAIFQNSSASIRILKNMLKRLVVVMKAYSKVFRLGRPRYMLAVGVLKYLTGDDTGARHAWKRGIDAAAQLRWAYEEGIIASDVALHLPMGSPERTSYLVHAGRCFLAEGMEEFQWTQEEILREEAMASQRFESSRDNVPQRMRLQEEINDIKSIELPMRNRADSIDVDHSPRWVGTLPRTRSRSMIDSVERDYSEEAVYLGFMGPSSVHSTLFETRSSETSHDTIESSMMSGLRGSSPRDVQTKSRLSKLGGVDDTPSDELYQTI